MIWPQAIQRRIDSRTAPYSKEALRLAVILEKLSILTREAVLAGGMSGLDDVLLDIIAECSSWYESRQGLREREGQIAAQEMRATLGGPLPEKALE